MLYQPSKNVLQPLLPLIQPLLPTSLSPTHPSSQRTLQHPIEMILRPVPHRLEDERLGQEQLDVVVGPVFRREALEEHDDAL